MNSEIHSFAAVWSPGEPPTTSSLPFRVFTSRASPKLAIVSHSLVVCHEMRSNFMLAWSLGGLDIGGHSPVPRKIFQTDQIQLFEPEDFKSGSLAAKTNRADSK